MSKKILVVGAGLAQVDAIKRCKELGYYVLASDGMPDAPGLKIADERQVIDVKDVERNLAWARKAHIDGVISYASDITLPTVHYIRRELGFPGLGKIPMEVSLNKEEQRERFKKAGLAQPRFKVVDALDGLESLAKELGFPLVVKPVDNSGSRGVTLVHQEDQLRPAYSAAVTNSKRGRVIVEQFIEGMELTVEGFSVNGEHHFLAISDKFKPRSSYRVATQLAYPAAITDEQRQKVVELMKAALDAAEVDNSPTHSEVILGPDGPQIVEIACRGGGFYVFTRVVEAVSGYDIVGNWTRLCLGDPIEDVTVASKGVVLRFYAAARGKLIGVTGLDDAKTIEGIETGLFLKPGDIVPELETDGSRTGWMIACGEDREQAIARADKASGLVKFSVEEIR